MATSTNNADSTSNKISSFSCAQQREEEKEEPTTNHTTNSKSHLHSLVDSDWNGLKNLHSRQRFALEMQEPWANYLLTRRKTIETRAYNLPLVLLGRSIDVLQTPQGAAKVSSLGNEIEVLSSRSSTWSKEIPSLIGWCRFISVKEYRTREDFIADEQYHLVSSDNPYGWKKGTKDQVIYGWVVGECGFSTTTQGGNDYTIMDDDKDNSPRRNTCTAATTNNDVSLRAIRRMRSLFEIIQQQPLPPTNTCNNNKDVAS